MDRSLLQPAGQTKGGGATLALSGMLAIQVVATVFFVLDVLADITGFEPLTEGLGHSLLELAAVVTLIVGITFTAREIRRVKRHHRRMEAQIRAASGAFAELLDEHFEAWGLTPSERDVANLAIKGLSIAEIAAVRQTKEGTVKAQCNAIYAKAGVSGRPQLLSLFVEELMGDGIVPAP